MPELPEVETVVRDLRPLLIGRTISALRVGDKKLRIPWRRAWKRLVVGGQVVAIHRRGKWILVELSGGCMIVHLGMTGQLTVRSRTDAMETHTHLIFTLDAGAGELRFRDIRRFGSIEAFASRGDAEHRLAERGLGPEPVDLTAERLVEVLAGSKRCVKAALLDQSVVAGVGNIYADESLFEAGLDPRTLAGKLTLRELERLVAAIKDVIATAIASRGSTIRDYVGGSGLMGGFQHQLRAYGRTGEPCFACRTPIKRQTLAGRSTHWCPNCQVARREARSSGPRGKNP